METLLNLRQETIDGLQTLKKYNHDACEGFRVAADKIEDADIAALFREFADSRGRFRTELEEAIMANKADVPDGGTFKGQLHRWWLGVRGSINAGDEKVVLTEALRGEESLIDAYKSVIKDVTGNPLNDVLHSHLETILGVRDRLVALEARCSE